MARFFIDRPVFAWVLAIVTMLAGVFAIRLLPIAQYPAIAPPAISITATYPGASAKTLEDSVTQVIEQKMKGLDRLQYMQSVSDSSGMVTLTEQHIRRTTDFALREISVHSDPSIGAAAPAPRRRASAAVAKTKAKAKGECLNAERPVPRPLG